VFIPHLHNIFWDVLIGLQKVTNMMLSRRKHNRRWCYRRIHRWIVWGRNYDEWKSPTYVTSKMIFLLSNLINLHIGFNFCMLRLPTDHFFRHCDTREQGKPNLLIRKLDLLW
jgi:hypothetical protein